MAATRTVGVSTTLGLAASRRRPHACLVHWALGLGILVVCSPKTDAYSSYPGSCHGCARIPCTPVPLLRHSCTSLFL